MRPALSKSDTSRHPSIDPRNLADAVHRYRCLRLLSLFTINAPNFVPHVLQGIAVARSCADGASSTRGTPHGVADMRLVKTSHSILNAQHAGELSQAARDNRYARAALLHAST
jgi:hypothetical protein